MSNLIDLEAARYARLQRSQQGNLLQAEYVCQCYRLRWGHSRNTQVKSWLRRLRIRVMFGGAECYPSTPETRKLFGDESVWVGYVSVDSYHLLQQAGRC